jgi:hypothetical protein
VILEAFLRGAIVFVIAGALSLLLARRSAALRHHTLLTLPDSPGGQRVGA